MYITIQNDKVRGVVDTFGGELISCQDNSKIEYLWKGDETFWSGRSPHLFPIIGTLKDNYTLIDGKIYAMNKHGFARNSEFEISEVTDSSVTLVLKDSAYTKEFYPYSFSFYVTHTLLENGFTTNYRIVNHNEIDMHFCIGGHVGVRCPLLTEEEFSDYEIVFDQPITASSYFPPDDHPIGKELLTVLMKQTDTLPLSYELFEQGAVILNKIVSHKLQLRHKQNHSGVSFEYDGFPVLALWTFGKKKAPYICLEPWHGLPAMAEDTEKLKEKPYIISLKPEESKQLQYTLNILAKN